MVTALPILQEETADITNKTLSHKNAKKKEASYALVVYNNQKIIFIYILGDNFSEKASISFIIKCAKQLYNISHSMWQRIMGSFISG